MWCCISNPSLPLTERSTSNTALSETSQCDLDFVTSTKSILAAWRHFHSPQRGHVWLQRPALDREYTGSRRKTDWLDQIKINKGNWFFLASKCHAFCGKSLLCDGFRCVILQNAQFITRKRAGFDLDHKASP
jgi:hypothetical protein